MCPSLSIVFFLRIGSFLARKEADAAALAEKVSILFVLVVNVV